MFFKRCHRTAEKKSNGPRQHGLLLSPISHLSKSNQSDPEAPGKSIQRICHRLSNFQRGVPSSALKAASLWKKVQPPMRAESSSCLWTASSMQVSTHGLPLAPANTRLAHPAWAPRTTGGNVRDHPCQVGWKHAGPEAHDSLS